MKARRGCAAARNSCASTSYDRRRHGDALIAAIADVTLLLENRMTMFRWLIAAAVVLAAGQPPAAAVSLSAVFGDNMVLQREMPVPVWGRADSGNNVLVSCAKIPRPVAVRYAWQHNPAGANLYNKDGLPASPFRTDNW